MFNTLHRMSEGSIKKPAYAGFFIWAERGKSSRLCAPVCTLDTVTRRPSLSGLLTPFARGHETAEEERLNQRTQYVVDRTFQLRVAINLMLIVLFLPAVLLANFYLVGLYVMSQNLEIADFPRDWGLVGLMLQHQWWMTILFVGACVGFTFGLVFYYTHRIAGPVYRFRRLFDALAEGQVGTPVQLRKGDCFENLASSVARANATLASSISELKTAAAVLSQKAGALGDRELGEQVAVINRVLGRFNVVSKPVPATETERVESPSEQ